MQKKIYFILLLYVQIYSFSQQNLVPNPSFELIGSATNPNFPVQNWDKPPGSGTTPDAFHTTYSQGLQCTSDRGVPRNGMGYSFPKSGNGYVGFLQFYNQGNQVDSREYIQAQLSSPLQAGNSYRIGLFVKKSPRSTYATNHFGIYLSDTAVHQSFNLPIAVTPQLDLTTVLYDTTNWTLMQKLYVAVGGESYITIGNFYTDVQCSLPNTGQYDPWCWLNVNAAYHYVDSVFVIKSELNEIDIQSTTTFDVYPNPVKDYCTLTIYMGFEEDKLLTIYDAMGRKISDLSFWENEKQIPTSDLPLGNYIIQLRIGDKNYYRRFNKY